MNPKSNVESLQFSRETIEPLLEEERGLTDDSLNAEREKTDDSLFDLRKKAEFDTDAQVESDRRHLDNDRNEGRQHRDQYHTVDPVLQAQRLTDDKSMLAERIKIDAAIQAERAIKDQALADFLESEREETDKSLSHERAQTDLAVSVSTNQFNEEVILHAQTRAELTTRDELIAIVSHDLRNPIGSVLTCAEMLLQDPAIVTTGSPLKSWIELIKRNAETSLQLISDILDMERVAQGKLELQLKLQDIAEAVRETFESFAPLAASHQISLSYEAIPMKIMIQFDRSRINQVLSNLIGNSLKFTPKGGAVSISVEQGENQSLVSIRDSGIGIPDDLKEKIFARYAQIQEKDRRGLGLGLYISKTLIEAHNGRIWVTTPVNGGSVFHFSLPHSR